MKWRDGNVRNKETFSDATFTIQAHIYNWLWYFVCFFRLFAWKYQFSFYPVLAAHSGRTHTLKAITVKFNRQTCHMNMNMETRRYVYTYFVTPSC